MARALFQAAQKLAPAPMAALIYRLMARPARRAPNPSEAQVLAMARASTLHYDGFEMRRYDWGDAGQPTVLLIHGWEGQSANFAAIIPLLLELGNRVIAIDAQAHGQSSGRQSQMFAYGQFLSEHFQQLAPDYLISHSFGSVSAAMALAEHENYPLKCWLMVTTPHRYRDRLQRAADQFGMTPAVLARVARKVEQELALDIDALDMAAYCRRFHGVEQAAIAHSADDKILLIEWSRAVAEAFSHCDFYELQGLGHYRILRSRELQDIVRKHFTQATAAAGNADPGARPGSG